ncbi:uncharacterized protein ELE39_002347 [Cryptosporidium sp. chipmunk genotype I]|uniref:uncharacterized protein n=1 Tax=Cryptosporidium sp. chipmunk genotype I TaxID=1280935 RepID=UPI00351A529D|nr:hypothetical protein ELE39_002347 [Cryptosporidium sp. chipmunk genotype I]
MLLNVEQIIGYFSLPNHFDTDLTTNERKNVTDDMYSDFGKFYGNELKLFDDLHIASIINSDKLYLYNVSSIIFSGNRVQDKCKALNISSLFNISLPFNPNCNCSLFFDKYTSILTISVSSNDGQLYIIEISVFGKCEYSFTILTTRSFKTELSNLKSLTQVTKSLFLACTESGIFGIISNSRVLKGEFSPLFIKKSICTETLEISTFQVVKTILVDKNTENIYLITFSETIKQLSLILIRFNSSESDFCTSIIDRKSDIQIGMNIETRPVISLLEGSDFFVLLINSTVYLYRILNLCDYNSNNINLQLSNYFNLDFEQSGGKKKKLIFSPEVYCNKSEIYIARPVFSENMINSYDLYLPIYEIHKIRLNNHTSNTFPSNNIHINNSTLVWSQGLQNSYYSAFDDVDLKYQLISNEKRLSNLEDIVNFLLNRIIGDCHSKTIFEMAFHRYLRFLESIISTMVGKEKHCELLSILYSTSKFEGLLNLIKNIYIHLEDKRSLNSEFELYGKCKFDVEKMIFLITPLHLLINYFKNIGNYFIRIFSDQDNTFVLSPISVSVISSLYKEELNEFSSISPNHFNSHLYISLDIIRNYLKLRYLVFNIIFNTKKMILGKHLLDLFNIYISDGINKKIILFSLIIELIEILSKKLHYLNKFKGIIKHYKSLKNFEKSPSDKISNFNFIYCDALTQNFTIDELKSLIQNIGQFFVNQSSISDDEILDFIGKSIKADHIGDINKFSLLNSMNITGHRYIKASNLELIDTVKIKNIISILNICSIITRNIFKFFSWKNLIRNTTLSYSCSFEHMLQFFSDNNSFLNLGKYMVTGKSNIISYSSGGTDECYSISSADQVYRVYLYFDSIYKFFSSEAFLNFAANDLSTYIFSNKIFWESFLNDFCSEKVSQECNFELVDLVYDYLEHQIINGCFEHNYVRYTSYLISLLPYKRFTSDLSLSILKQLLSNIKLVDEVVELIKPEDVEDKKNTIEEFSSNNLKVIYFISLIFKLFNQSKIKMYHNSIYFNLLEISINLICSCFSSCSPSQKILVNNLHRRYLIQYIFLSENDIEDFSIVKLLNKSLLYLNSKYEKMLFLMALWIKHYFSDKVDNKSEMKFFTISTTVFGNELKEFYPLLIKIYWKKQQFLRDLNSGVSLELYSKSILIIRSIYTFLMNEWKKEKKYQEIVTLAYLNALAKYCDLFLSYDNINALFPENWIEFRLINHFLDEELDSFKILNEVLENLEGMIQYFSSEKEAINVDSESLNSIISSLSTYIIYSNIALSSQSNNLQYSDKPICIPNIFFGINLPRITNQDNCLIEINHKVTYLPSIAYISYLKWYFVGIKKLLISNLTQAETYQHFNNYGKYLERYRNCLENNGIYFRSVFNPNVFCSKSLTSLFEASIIELNYYLIIIGYFETAYRLTEAANKFMKNYLKDYPLNLSNNRWIIFSNSLTRFSPNNIYRTIGFWMFNYCFFLSNDTIYLNSLVENTNNFLIQTTGKKKKKLSDSQPDPKITAFDEIILQNSKLRNIQILEETDNLAFSINISYWNSIIDRINCSPHFLQGVHIALLMNEHIYGAVNTNNSSENTSILPIQLTKIYKDPEYLIKIIRSCSASSDQHLNIFITVIENLLSFSFIDEALRFISVIISDNQVELPIYFLAKVRYLIRSSNNANIHALSEKFESIIHKSISIGTLA